VTDIAPMVRIVRGEPDDVEVAAAVAAITFAAARPTQTETAPPRSLWAQRARNVRPAPPRGVGAWRASSLPR